MIDYGLMSDDLPPQDSNAPSPYALETLTVQVSTKPIVIKVNLSHTQKRKPTSGGSSMLQEVEIQTYPNCSVFCLKHLIMGVTQSPISDQVISYKGQTLENAMSLFHYQIGNETMLKNYNDAEGKGRKAIS
jgi:hypothetical protein